MDFDKNTLTIFRVLATWTVVKNRSSRCSYGLAMLLMIPNVAICGLRDSKRYGMRGRNIINERVK